MPPIPESARAAREFTAATMRSWRILALAEDAVIVASELVANAIGHGAAPAASGGCGSPVSLTWLSHGDRLTCVVTDYSSEPPVMAPPSVDAESGHGLHIVHALTGAWGWTMIDDRQKAVWAVLVSTEPLP